MPRYLAARYITAATLLVGFSPALGQPAEPPSVLPSGVTAPEGLGAYFESPLTGIAFRPFAGAKQINRVGDPKEIVTFVDDGRNWTLKASKLTLDQPRELTQKSGSVVPGLLEIYTDQLKDAPSAEVLRSDVTNVRAKEMADTAMIAVRFVRGTQNLLTQQAIIKFSDSIYYSLELTSPGAKPGSGPDQSTPDEKLAVATFSSIIDSVKLLDRGDVKQDQVQRLERTRFLLLANWTETRIRKAMIPEQWLRIIHDGKDIGYTYIVEEEAERAGRKGVLVGYRSRSIGDQPGEQVDQESMFFCGFDRKLEEWTTVTQITDKNGKQMLNELGTSSMQSKNVVDRGAPKGDPSGKDPNQPATKRIDSYVLKVMYGGRAASPPVEREPPPWYLPQALGQLLPRLIPLRDTKTYLFASYVSDRHELMMRYVDVLPAKDVSIGGQTYHAVPISDRIGIQGQPTLHYYTIEGKYLGTVAPAAKITILPTDPETLQKLWDNNADLTKPKARDDLVPAPAPTPKVPASPGEVQPVRPNGR